ncbi:MAG: glycoside hydrolase family 9 protein [Halanaerobiales bacterium]
MSRTINFLKVLVLFLLILSFSLAANTVNAANAGSGGVDSIHINQVGYRPEMTKIVIVNSPEQEVSSFQIIDVSTGETVYTSELTGPKFDDATGDTVYQGDFSELEEEGQYLIRVDELGESFQFNISDNVYEELRRGLLKAFYYQRCGDELLPEYAGEWAQGPCHLDDAYLWTDQDQYIDTTGGWHDAGDYGKYSGPGANAVAHLLLSYELYPEVFTDQLGINESGDQVPDVLNEARFKLEWLLKMQNSEGGVYHKVTTRNFAGMIKAEDSNAKRYVLPVSSSATGSFAAVMAMASRVYQPFDEDFSKEMLEAAEKSWEWLENHPNAKHFKNPQGVNTGEYGDWNDRDERYWAAVELYRLSGEDKYHEPLEQYMKYGGISLTDLGWQNLGGFGTISYLMMDEELRIEETYDELKDELLTTADRLVRNSGYDGYRLAMNNSDYYWGSNGGLMNKAAILIIANELEENQDYIDLAASHFHYLLGKNALSQSYVTGYGDKPIMNPHHRPSEAFDVGVPVPGLVAGGPNKNFQDNTIKAYVSSDTPPARVFVDKMGSYSTNEITIYWNSPAVFVSTYFAR